MFAFRELKNSQKILFQKYFCRKYLIILAILLLTIITFAALYTVVIGNQITTVEGKIYINGISSQSDANVILSFQTCDESDSDGLDFLGQYRIDFSGHDGEIGFFYVTIDGNEYCPTDDFGNTATILIEQGIHEYYLDLNIIIENNNQDNNSSNESDDSEGSNDSNDSGGTGETDDSGETDDTDDSNDSGDSGGSDDSNDSGDSGGSGGTDDSGETDDTDESDESDNQNENYNFDINKYVWNTSVNTWSKDIKANVGETVKFNITLSQNNSPIIQNILVIDNLSDGLEFRGNLTINKVDYSPQFDYINNSLILSNLTLIENETIYIEYDSLVLKNGTFDNFASAFLMNGSGSIFRCKDEAKIVGVFYNNLYLTKLVKAKNGLFLHEIHTDVGDTVQFSLQILNMGKVPLNGVCLIDSLSKKLEYIPDSSKLIFDNMVMSCEPIIENEKLYWNYLDIYTHNYLEPGKNISILFNATVLDGPIVINKANVVVFQGHYDEIMNVTASAIINCSKPIDELMVNAGGPYQGYLNELVYFNCTVSGGQPPYQLKWELSNDGLYNDAYGTFATYIWNSSGIKNISIKVIDKNNNYATSFAQVNIIIKPITIDLGNQYSGFLNESIYFNCSVKGGIPPYQYKWDFNNDGLIDYNYGPNATYKWNSLGIFTINLTVTDSSKNNASDFVDVNISVRPLSVMLEKNITGSIYDLIHLKAIISGGLPPFNFTWDLDDDGEFDDAIGQSIIHYWGTTGTFLIHVKITDSENTSVYNSTTVKIIIKNSQPEKPQKPQGPTFGKTETQYEYSTSSYDNDNDKLYYLWDWDDNSESDWIGPFNSNEVISGLHSFKQKGTFHVRVKCKDIYDNESEWSDVLIVDIPTLSIKSIIQNFINNVIERFPLFAKFCKFMI